MIASTSLRSSTHGYFEFLSRHQFQNFAECNRAVATVSLRGTPVAPFVCRISISPKKNWCRISCPSIFRTCTENNFLHIRATSFEADADGVDLADGVAVCGGSDSNSARLDETNASSPVEPDDFDESDANNDSTRANGVVGHGSGPRQTGWHALDPIWQSPATPAALQSTPLIRHLAPSWRLMLLSDGSVTRHLSLLTGQPVRIECLEMRPIGSHLEGLVASVDRIPGPRLQRQVHLRSSHGRVLVYATSWWAAGEVGQYLKAVQEPIWDNLFRQKAELFREVEQIYWGHSAELERVFGVEGPFWGRHYIFFHKGKPLTVIYEVFSPALEDFLGPTRSFVSDTIPL